jgi:hypothetical protein
VGSAKVKGVTDQVRVRWAAEEGLAKAVIDHRRARLAAEAIDSLRRVL